MAKDISSHILLTGAGFTKNFGGFLAKEMWSKIFNDSRIQSCPRIKELLFDDFDYESIYYRIIHGDYTDEEKDTIGEVIFRAYRTLDDICSGWRFMPSAPCPVNISGVNKLIDRFSGNNHEFGFFFTLNQDLFIERHFNGPSPRLIHPGIRKIPNANKINSRLPLDKSQDFVKLPTGDELRNDSKKLFSSTIHYVKLHGSYGWLSSEGSNGYVIGKNKEGQITDEPLLSWYFELFKEALSNPSRKLLIIGYGFGDRHVNELIAGSIKDHNLKFYVISPSDQEKFIGFLKFVDYGSTLLQGLAGYFPYSLLDIFPTDQSESSAWKEVRGCYFG